MQRNCTSYRYRDKKVKAKQKVLQYSFIKKNFFRSLPKKVLTFKFEESWGLLLGFCALFKEIEHRLIQKCFYETNCMQELWINPCRLLQSSTTQ